MLVFGCHRFTNAKLVGTWRFEDDNEIEEMSLNEDHSFQSVTTYKNELSTPSSFPEKGTWRVEGAELRIESASVYIPKDRKTRRHGIIDLTRGVLQVKNVDGTKSVTYRRLELPSCDDGSVVASEQTVREADLLGSWKIHYTTHDYQLRLMPNGQLAMLGFISDQWDPLSEGKWHIQGNHLIMDSAKSSSEADPRHRRHG